jgi:hypothetical protein
MSLTSVLLAFAPALAAKSVREKELEIAMLETRLADALARCEELERRMTGGLLERYAQQAWHAQQALLGTYICNCTPSRAQALGVLDTNPLGTPPLGRGLGVEV